MLVTEVANVYADFSPAARKAGRTAAIKHELFFFVVQSHNPETHVSVGMIFIGGFFHRNEKSFPEQQAEKIKRRVNTIIRAKAAPDVSFQYV